MASAQSHQIRRRRQPPGACASPRRRLSIGRLVHDPDQRPWLWPPCPVRPCFGRQSTGPVSPAEQLGALAFGRRNPGTSSCARVRRSERGSSCGPARSGAGSQPDRASCCGGSMAGRPPCRRQTARCHDPYLRTPADRRLYGALTLGMYFVLSQRQSLAHAAVQGASRIIPVEQHPLAAAPVLDPFRGDPVASVRWRATQLRPTPRERLVGVVAAHRVGMTDDQEALAAQPFLVQRLGQGVQ